MKRGRPPKIFAEDPERHLMAIAVAFWSLGASKRGGCEIAVASVEGWPVGQNTARDKGGHGLNLLEWRFELKLPHSFTATIVGRARDLRKKIKKSLRDPAAAAWLQEMAKIHLLAWGQLGAPQQHLALEAEIMRRAEALGEADYGRARLLTMADARRLAPARKCAQRIISPKCDRNNGRID